MVPQNGWYGKELIPSHVSIEESRAAIALCRLVLHKGIRTGGWEQLELNGSQFTRMCPHWCGLYHWGFSFHTKALYRLAPIRRKFLLCSSGREKYGGNILGVFLASLPLQKLFQCDIAGVHLFLWLNLGGRIRKPVVASCISEVDILDGFSAIIAQSKGLLSACGLLREFCRKTVKIKRSRI